MQTPAEALQYLGEMCGAYLATLPMPVRKPALGEVNRAANLLATALQERDDMLRKKAEGGGED